jgi:hypothetical protein
VKAMAGCYPANRNVPWRNRRLQPKTAFSR